MLNKIVLIGRLTEDVNLKYTQNGHAVGAFTLAVDRPFTTQGGEKETDFINIVTWRKLAETCANHIGKGRLVAVEGRLQIRSYDDNDGNRRRVSEVVAEQVRFLDYPKDNDSKGNSNDNSSNNTGNSSSYNNDFDDVPF